MREIKTHTHRNLDEIMTVLEKTGSFTAPLGLPHWRYDGTRRNCHVLCEAGLMARKTKQDIHVHFSRGSNFERWLNEGKPPAKDLCNLIKKERKLANPPKPRTKICVDCGVKFQTINFQQKRCKKNCKHLHEEPKS